MQLCRTLAFALACVFAAGLVHAEDASAVPTRTLGVRGVIEGVVGPGELRPRRTEAGHPPIVVRILSATPHGSAFRYDLEFYGLEAGRYDLGDYLELSDGSPPQGLPALPVLVRDPLPASQPLQPEALSTGRLPERGGYQTALIVGGVAWGLVLMWLGWAALRRTRTTTEAAEAAAARDPLGELVSSARERSLTTEEQGQLERLLLTRWFLEAGLSDLTPERALAELREHALYSAKLSALEAWLHRPAPEPADLEALLAGPGA